MDLKDIKSIVDLMKKNSITEFELEREDFKVKLKRGSGSGNVQVLPDDYFIPASARPMSLPPAGAVPQPTQSAPPAPPADEGEEIKSPMIGTFYRSPSPESASYVEIGSEVGPETVVCIIEAMKVMNEIKAEVRGVITQALVENAKPVEYGQPLFKIKPL